MRFDDSDSDSDMPPQEVWANELHRDTATAASMLTHVATDLLASAPQETPREIPEDDVEFRKQLASAPAVLEELVRNGSLMRPHHVASGIQMRSADFGDFRLGALEQLKEQLKSQPDLRIFADEARRADEDTTPAPVQQPAAEPEKITKTKPARDPPKIANKDGKLPQPPPLPQNRTAIGAAQQAVLEQFHQSPINSMLSQQRATAAVPMGVYARVNQPYLEAGLYAQPPTQPPHHIAASQLPQIAAPHVPQAPGLVSIAAPPASVGNVAMMSPIAPVGGIASGYGISGLAGGADALGTMSGYGYAVPGGMPNQAGMGLSLPGVSYTAPYNQVNVHVAAPPQQFAQRQPVPKAPARGNRPSRMEVTRQRPCAHNQWERISKKKNSISLRCRTCKACWKTKLEFFEKCAAFYAGHCEEADACPHPHIYSKAAEKHQMLKRQQECEHEEQHEVDTDGSWLDE